MKKKILLLVLLIVLLLGAGVAYAYFATDTFKSEKEMFFSYLFSDELSNKFKEDKMVEYFDKKLSTPYTNKGKVTVNIDGIEDEELEILKESEISFEGQVDNSKKLEEQKITMDFSKGFNIPVKIKRDGEAIGVQTDFIDKKYVVLKNENLKALLAKFDVDSENIPDKIDFEKSKFTQKEIAELSEKYTKILKDNLEDELFSKEKIDNQTIITLKITEEKVKDILIKILKELREDQTIISKLPDGFEVSDYKDEIDELISDLEDETTDENNTCEARIFVESKKLKKCEIAFFEEEKAEATLVIENLDNQLSIKVYEEKDLLLEMNITKKVEQDDVILTINMKANSEDDENVEIEATVRYKNVLKSDNVEEIYNIKVSYSEDEEYSSYTNGKAEISLNFSNLVTFTNSVEIEGFNEDNAIIINNATDEELQALLLKIYKNLGLL